MLHMILRPLLTIAFVFASLVAHSQEGSDQFIIKLRPYIGALSKEELSDIVSDISSQADIRLRFLRPMSGNSIVVGIEQLLTEKETVQIISRITSHQDVEYAEPNSIISAFQAQRDPRLNDQWNLDASANTVGGINVENAWQISEGAGVVIAIIDSGFQAHQDITNNLVLPGWDFIEDVAIARDGDPADGNAQDEGTWCGATSSDWHGTHVAGIAGAERNNGTEIAGVSPQAGILPVRVLGRCADGRIEYAVNAIRWAAGIPVPGSQRNQNPARVLNLSFGTTEGRVRCGPALRDALKDVRAQGVSVVAAAGNEMRDAGEATPANCPYLITVAASDRNALLAGYSNFGDKVELTAPGGDGVVATDLILSTSNAGQQRAGADAMAWQGGTSQAAPHVAGVIALMLAEDPDLRPLAIRKTLQSSARDFPAGSDCEQIPNRCGAGLLDAENAVDAVRQPSVHEELTSSKE